MTHSLTARVLVFAVALGMTLSMGASVAGAQTSIDDLLSQIADLQAQLAGLQGGSGSSVCPYTWTRDLSVGATGADVQQLQSFLNDNGQTVAASGAGSQGAETTYYGPLTASAVSAFQVAYAAQVLTPLGLTNGTGYFGPSSRAQANALCVTAPEDEEEDEEDEADEADLDGETDLRSFEELNDPDNEDVAEGDEDVPVFGFEFDVEDANALVQRVDVTFQAVDDNLDEDPWDYIEEVSLWFDGDEVARNDDAGDEDEWDDSDNDTQGHGTEEFTIRFNGVDVLVEEDTTPEFIVAVSAVNNIDSADSGQEFDVWVDDDGLRAIDGEGINHEIGDDNATSRFQMEEEGDDAGLSVSLSSDSPDGKTLEVDDDDTSDAHTLLIADVEAEGADLEFEGDIEFLVETTGANYDELVADIWVEIDGDVFDDFSVEGATGTTATVTIDIDGDFELDEDDEVEMAVVVEFLQQDGNYDEGDSIEVNITSANVENWEVETSGGTEVDSSDLDGSASGDEFTLRVDGISIELADDPVGTLINNDGDDNDEASFQVEVEVTAFGEDFFIPQGAINLATTTLPGGWTDEGMAYNILDGNGDVVATGTAVGTFSPTSGADLEADGYRVNDGSGGETFELNITYTPAADGTFQLQLEGVGFDIGGGNEELQAVAPRGDYLTNTVNVTN